MFSGIVEATGEIRSLTESATARTLSIVSPFDDLRIGDSVCVSGVCLTVVTSDDRTFEADVSAETIRRTTLGQLRVGDPVNLERSLRLADRLSGHLVFGHVDGTGTVISITREGDSVLYRFRVPAAVARYLVEKGSVAVDGVSLTVFGCSRSSFSVALIPHTARVTTLGRLQAGMSVNLEADMIGKYVEKLLAPHAKANSARANRVRRRRARRRVE